MNQHLNEVFNKLKKELNINHKISIQLKPNIVAYNIIHV